MKREYKGFVAGLLVAGVIAGTIGTAGAVVGRTQAALDYNNIKISLNGQTITPKDANGTRWSRSRSMEPPICRCGPWERRWGWTSIGMERRIPLCYLAELRLE